MVLLALSAKDQRERDWLAFYRLAEQYRRNTGISWSPMTMSAKENALEPGLAPSVWNTKAVPIRGLPRRGWIYSMPLVWSGMSGSFSGTECTRHWNGICKSMARRGSLSPMSQRRGQAGNLAEQGSHGVQTGDACPRRDRPS